MSPKGLHLNESLTLSNDPNIFCCGCLKNKVKHKFNSRIVRQFVGNSRAAAQSFRYLIGIKDVEFSKA
jgi:hypothetical protein